MSVSLCAIKDYTKNFPAEVPTKAAQGFITTAVIHLASGSAKSMALLGGTLAVTASIIEAVTRPIIRAVFPENPGIAASIQFFIPTMVVLSLATSMTPWIGMSYTMTAFLPRIIATLALNYQSYERNKGFAIVF